MAVMYEINLQVDTEIRTEYLDWLKKHVQEMLQFDGFRSVEVQEVVTGDLLDDSRQGHQTLFSVRYNLRDQTALDNYLNHHAPAMRQQGLDAFGNRFTARRRVLQAVLELP
mmetsp:Transcript_38947/g.86626  ORF Transcript_38947/g.86626 Transcript_38947/m.86626 type:complete len:111 (-) Transcript_38947:803-1135(-)